MWKNQKLRARAANLLQRLRRSTVVWACVAWGGVKFGRHNSFMLPINSRWMSSSETLRVVGMYYQPIHTEIADRCESLNASSRSPALCALGTASWCQAAFKQDWKHGQSVILAN